MKKKKKRNKKQLLVLIIVLIETILVNEIVKNLTMNLHSPLNGGQSFGGVPEK